MGWSLPISTVTMHQHTTSRPATKFPFRASHSLAAVVGEGVGTGLDTMVGDATGEGLAVGLPT
jgi:hypothetical protein